jgi:adenylate cyclase class IV
MVLGFLSLFLVVLTTAVSADGPESCPTRAIEAKKIMPDSTNFSLSLARLPEKDQKKTNMCYAYVASDLIDYYLKNSEVLESKSALDPEVHPLWLAYLQTKLEASEKKERVLLRSGQTSVTLDQIQKFGNCSYAYIESELKKNKLETAELARLIDRILENAYTEEESEQKEKERKKVRTIAAQVCEMESIPISRKALRRFRGASLDEFSFEIAFRSFLPKCFSDEAFLDRERMAKIPKRLVFDRGNAPGTYEKETKARIEKAIELGWPSAIAHCSDLYNSPDPAARTKGPFYNSEGRKLVRPEKCGQHVASIIGQAWIGKKCQYLVRQSWGNSPIPSRACRCWDKGRTRHDYCSKFEKDERGVLLGCYLGQDELIGASSSITYVVDSKVRAALESAPK